VTRVATAGTIALLLSYATAAHADTPCVLLRDASAQIAEQLRAALAPRNIELCTVETASPVATLDVSENATQASLTLTVRDALTNKSVSRDVDLAAIPPDARSLVIAQAADELLRASWAELLVKDAPPPARPVPVEVTTAVEKTIEAPRVVRAPIVEVGAGGSAETYTRGRAAFGPDLALVLLPSPRIGARARFGLRVAPKSSAVDGDVQTSATVYAIGALFGVLPRTGRLGLDVVPEIVVTRLSFDARASAAGVARSDTSTAIYATLGAQGWLVIAQPVRVGLGVLAGAPIRAVRAVDADSTVSGASGALFGASLLVAGAF
jgi:hypothetical protein